MVSSHVAAIFHTLICYMRSKQSSPRHSAQFKWRSFICARFVGAMLKLPASAWKALSTNHLFCKLGIPCGCACCSTSARQVTRSFTCTVKLMCPCYTVSSSIPNTWTGPNQLVHTVPVVPHKAVAEASKIGEIGCCESGMAERIH